MKKIVSMFTCYWGFYPMLERNKYYHVSISCATPKNLLADFQLNEAKPDWSTIKKLCHRHIFAKIMNSLFTNLNIQKYHI